MRLAQSVAYSVVHERWTQSITISRRVDWKRNDRA
jgi:hypothetical protein